MKSNNRYRFVPLTYIDESFDYCFCFMMEVFISCIRRSCDLYHCIRDLAVVKWKWWFFGFPRNLLLLLITSKTLYNVSTVMLDCVWRFIGTMLSCTSSCYWELVIVIDQWVCGYSWWSNKIWNTARFRGMLCIRNWQWLWRVMDVCSVLLVHNPDFFEQFLNVEILCFVKFLLPDRRSLTSL